MSSASYPLVTIGITCFNAQDTIRRALHSALEQDWPLKEIVVVDDCSRDASTHIIKEIVRSNGIVRLIEHTDNSGPATARNTVLKHANGEFVAFFDDDDESLPERISHQIARLVQYEQLTGAELVACYAAGIRRYPNGYSLALPAIGSADGAVPNGPELANYLLFYEKRSDWRYGSGTPTCALLARRRTFDYFGGFDTSFRRVEDADFAIRLALAGGHFVGSKIPLFFQYSTDAPDKSPERNFESERALAIKHRIYLESIGRYYYAVNWPELRFRHFKKQYLRFVYCFVKIFARHPLKASAQIMQNGPRRLIHEFKMRRRVTVGRGTDREII